MSKNANSNAEKLIPTTEVIQKAIARGVSFGYGDPKNRIRYFIKNGLLPNQTRKRDGKIVTALMPKYSIDLLVNIQSLQDEKKLSISEIKDYVNENGGIDSIRFLNQLKVRNNTKGKSEINSNKNNIKTKNIIIKEKDNKRDKNSKKHSKIDKSNDKPKDKPTDKSTLKVVDPTEVKIKIYHSNGASTSVKSHAVEPDPKIGINKSARLLKNSDEKLGNDEATVKKSTKISETTDSSKLNEPFETASKSIPSKSDAKVESTTSTGSTLSKVISTTDISAPDINTNETNIKNDYGNDHHDEYGDKRDKDDNKRDKDSNKTDKDDDKKVQSPQISPLQVAKSYYDVNFNLDENEEKDNFVNKETADIVTSTHKTLKIFGALLIAIVLIFVLFFTTLPISKNSTNVAIDTNQGEVLGVASNLVEDNPVKRLAKIVKEKYFKNLFNKIDQTELGSLSKFNPINEKLSQYNDQQENNENNQNTHDGENILGEEDENSDPRFFVNIPSVLNELQVRRDVVFDQNISVGGISTFLGNLEADGQNLNLGLGEITASNVVYSLTPGAGIEIVGGQTPTISNTGVLSFGGETGDIELTQGSGIGVSGTTITNLGVLSLGGQTGDLVLEAGAGISVSGLNVTNIDPGSAQSIFKTINVDGSPVVATSNVDSINFLSGPGVNIALDPVTKTLTFDSLPAESELDIEAYIFDDDNTGTMTSGNLDLDQMGFVGTLPLTAGGLDMDLSAATDGQLLIGNGAGFSLSTLTQGAGITIVNGAGEITIANLLGNTIDTTEIVNQTILPEDINALAAPLNNQILTYNSASQRFQWQDVGGIVPGDISTVGDITEGAAFSQTSAYDGNFLYFEGASGSLEFEIALTAEPATSDQILTLPNKTGTIAVLDDIHDPVSLVTNGYTFLSLVDQQLQLGQVDLSNDVINLLPVTNGGTGANTPGGARANLGLEIGVNVQAYDANTSLLGQTIEGSEITDGTITYAELDVIAAPLDTQVLSFDNTSGQFNWLDQIDINAGFLNSLTSDDFLRSNASDQFTSGTLTFNTGTQLTLSAGTVFNLNGTFNLGGA